MSSWSICPCGPHAFFYFRLFYPVNRTLQIRFYLRVSYSVFSSTSLHRSEEFRFHWRMCFLLYEIPFSLLLFLFGLLYLWHSSDGTYQRNGSTSSENGILQRKALQIIKSCVIPSQNRSSATEIFIEIGHWETTKNSLLDASIILVNEMEVKRRVGIEKLPFQSRL